MSTKNEIDKSIFLVAKNNNNEATKLVVSPNNFQVGLVNSPSTLTSTGHATFYKGIASPNQPSFLAYANSNQNNIDINTDVVIDLGGKVFDTCQNFNTENSTFIAPVSGKYVFNANVMLTSADTTANFYALFLVTSQGIYTLSIFDVNLPSIRNFWCLNGSVIANMQKNDEAFLRIYQSNGVNLTDIRGVTAGSPNTYNTYFSGWLLG